MGEGPYKIRWTENAIEDQDIVVEYLLRNWSIKVIADFLNILEGKLNTLLSQPLMGIVSEKNPLIRSISITKHNRLYYRISDDVIVLLNLFDTRKNPEKNPY